MVELESYRKEIWRKKKDYGYDIACTNCGRTNIPDKSEKKCVHFVELFAILVPKKKKEKLSGHNRAELEEGIGNMSKMRDLPQ